jgi:hypothetical protein
MPGSDTFTEPTTLAEAESLRAELTGDVQSIQAQLGDKQRIDDEGRRLSSQEYWTWKKRAQHALNQKLEDLRAVKLWMRENRPESAVLSLDAQSHLANLHTIVSTLMGEGVEFEASEKEHIVAAGHYLRSAR